MNKAITATVLSAALAAGGATTASALYKDVELVIDGQVQEADAFALTVADVLAARGVTLTEGDEVVPAPNTTVTNGTTVTVRYRKRVTLEVDGTRHTFLTTAATLSEALARPTQLAANSDSAELGDARFATSLSSPLPRSGVTVEVTTPKQVTLSVGGKKKALTTTAPTVSDLLSEQGLVASSTDRLSHDADTTIVEGQKIILDRVVLKTRTRTERVGFKVVRKNNAGLWKGESRVVTAGKAGKARRTYRITVLNGEVDKRVVVAETILTKPTAQVLEVGTKTTSNGVGINLARAAMWDRIARCESGGNWKINTGNGYYGGLQFARASWNAMGGRDFAAYPHHASRAEQITVANRYYAVAGTRPWSCA